MLAAKNLSIVRSKGLVLNNISTEMQPGEITAICGPNGAGKSTLLAALAGLMKPHIGHLMLDAGELSALHPRLRAQAIGYLPQGSEVAWDVSVASLVALGRLPHGDGGGDAGEAAVARALAACDLAQLAHRPVSTLSGGERSRALLARVLAGEPRWILTDEPLAAFDLAHQLAIMAVLRAAAAEGCGVVLVVHDLALAMNHADKVLVLGGGEVQAEGSPEDALSEDVIERVWRVPVRWLGERGARALLSC